MRHKDWVLPYVIFPVSGLSRDKNRPDSSTSFTPNIISKMAARSSSWTSPFSSLSYICKTTHTLTSKTSNLCWNGCSSEGAHLEGQFEGFHWLWWPMNCRQSHDVVSDVYLSISMLGTKSFWGWDVTRNKLISTWKYHLKYVIISQLN